MKKPTLVAMGLSACIAFTATPLLAQDKPAEKSAEKPAPAAGGEAHSHFTKIPATVEEIWQAIQKQQGKLAAVVEKKDLGEAHDHAFAIRDLVKALPAIVADELKTKAEEGVKDITKLAADIDKSGAAGAQKATEANVKKMDEAIAKLKTNLKANEVKK